MGRPSARVVLVIANAIGSSSTDVGGRPQGSHAVASSGNRRVPGPRPLPQARSVWLRATMRSHAPRRLAAALAAIAIAVTAAAALLPPTTASAALAPRPAFTIAN